MVMVSALHSHSCYLHVCMSIFITPEYAEEVSGEDSQLLEMSSVPGRDHRPADSGYCSAGNSTPVFLQTLVPPKMKLCLHMSYTSMPKSA